jgi:hypothetical protein
MWRYASGGSQWLARLASLMVAAELLLALHLTANAIESTNNRGDHAASIGTAIEAYSFIIQTDKDRHRLAWRISIAPGGWRTILIASVAAPLLPQQSRATLQSPLKQLSVDRVEAKKERTNDCHALFGCTKCRMEKRRSFER